LISTGFENLNINIISVFTQLQNIYSLLNEVFRPLVVSIDNRLGHIDGNVGYLADTVDKTSNELKVSITSIPTEQAIVVTNNITHPILDVAVIVPAANDFVIIP